jgi:hypothetical protein
VHGAHRGLANYYAAAGQGELLGLIRATAAEGTSQPLPITTAAIAALGDLCLAMAPGVLDARSNASLAAPLNQIEATEGFTSAELLQLSSIDLLIHRMRWAADLADGGVVLYNQDDNTCEADILALGEVCRAALR